MSELNRKRESKKPLSDVEAELILVEWDIVAIIQRIKLLETQYSHFTVPVAQKQAYNEIAFLNAKLLGLEADKTKLKSELS